MNTRCSVSDTQRLSAASDKPVSSSGPTSSGSDLGEGKHSGDPGRVIRHLLRVLQGEHRYLTEETFDLICDQLLDLAFLLRQDGHTRAGTGYRARIEAEIRNSIREHAHETRFDVTALAAALGWSPRYIQQILQASNTTASTLIRKERLRLAYDRLSSVDWQDSTIAHIAHSSGFSSHAFFATVFRQEFGMPPREARRRARTEARTCGAGH